MERFVFTAGLNGDSFNFYLLRHSQLIYCVIPVSHLSHQRKTPGPINLTGPYFAKGYIEINVISQQVYLGRQTELNMYTVNKNLKER